MKIRVATLSDIPTLVQFGESFVSESPNYKNRGYDVHHAANHFSNLINGTGVIFVAEYESQVIGGFAGGIVNDWFSNQKMAFDYVLYIKPEFRKSHVAFELISAFITWSKLMGANRIQCGTATGVETKACVRLYKKFGFIETGTFLDLEI